MRTTRFQSDIDSVYDELRRQVLDRDGWKCQFCGARQNLDSSSLDVSIPQWPRMKTKT